MSLILYSIGLLSFLAAIAIFIYMRLAFRDKHNWDTDDYYYEFEEQHPQYAAYLRWSHILKATITIGMLFTFLAIVC